MEWTSGAVRNVTHDRSLQVQHLPSALHDIINADGVEAMLRADGYLSS